MPQPMYFNAFEESEVRFRSCYDFGYSPLLIVIVKQIFREEWSLLYSKGISLGIKGIRGTKSTLHKHYFNIGKIGLPGMP